ncbi:MAG: MFS transporter, partial [Candidatus Thermoplasmatota archaeon]|nr:MFS transporter [Candidatus Thermoplasmatota archaeon]
WRILFFTTAIIGLIALVVRKYSSESPVFQEYVKKEKVEKWPLLRLFRDRWRAVIATITIAGSLLFLNSITLSLYPTILETVDFFGKSISGVALFFINAISIGGVILGGFIAGRSLKRLSFMLIYTLMFLVVSAAIVSFVFRNNLLLVSAAFSAQAFFEAMIFSTLPAFLTEVFSKRFRTTAVGSVYNIGSMIGSIGIFVVPYYAGIYGWSTVWSIAVVIFSLILIAGVSLSIGSYSREIKSGDLIVD